MNGKFHELPQIWIAKQEGKSKKKKKGRKNNKGFY